jgi:hypothetical protein
VPRYRTTGIPPAIAAVGLSAFMPHYTRLAASGAQAYKGQVTGRPGTAAVPMNPDSKLGGGSGLNDLAMAGTSRSSDAPDAIWPNQYWVTPAANFWPGAGMPVQIYNPVRPQDTTMVPVPATDLRALYQARAANLAGGVSPGGSRALRQPATFVRWARRVTGNGSNQ